MPSILMREPSMADRIRTKRTRDDFDRLEPSEFAKLRISVLIPSSLDSKRK